MQFLEEETCFQASVSVFHKLERGSKHSGQFICLLFEDDLLKLRREIDNLLDSMKERQADIDRKFEDDDLI